MWKPYLKFITKRFLDIIPHTEIIIIIISLPVHFHTPRKFKIIDFRLKFMLKNLFYFVYVRLSLWNSFLFPPFVQPQLNRKSNQSHSWAKNYTERMKIIVVKQKQSWKKFLFFVSNKSFCKKLCYRKCIWSFLVGGKSVECISVFSPHFPCFWKKYFLCAIVVWQPENVYNHLKYITVEYKRHYANRTYFCHFPS